jgi:Arc/MetJ family transcription regulator
MRTNIDIDDKLMKQAMKAANAATKKATVEAALRQMVQLKRQEGIRELFGKIQWVGDLDAMRESRVLEWEGKRMRARQAKGATRMETRRETSAAR